MTRHPRVLLIRHGVSANVHPGGLVDAAGMQRWRDGENAAGITPDSIPPRALIDRVAAASLVMASDLPRAIESAERLAPGRPVQVSPLFRESVTELPQWLHGRWPVRVWRIGSGTLWMYRMLLGTDASTAELERTAQAARLVGERSREHELIAVVCHGVFRRLLGRRLVRDGWSAVPGPHSYRHWSVWEFIAPVNTLHR